MNKAMNAEADKASQGAGARAGSVPDTGSDAGSSQASGPGVGPAAAGRASRLTASALGREFREGPRSVSVLSDISFTLERGTTHAIMGRSGCGKSTLLHLLGGLDRPSTGEVTIDDAPFSRLGTAARARQRQRHLGFVYQFHHLLPEFTALENVAMACLIGRADVAEATAAAEAVLAEVGLSARLGHRPAELSGGERQRVAVARAMVAQPAFLLADEPTGNLDSRSAGEVLDLLLALNHRTGAGLLIVTHDAAIAQRVSHRWILADGRLNPTD